MPKYGSKYGSSLPKAAEIQGFHDFMDIVKRRIFRYGAFAGVGQPARQLIRCAMR